MSTAAGTATAVAIELPTERELVLGTVVAVCRSDAKGTPKHAVSEVRLRRGHGVESDAHAGDWHRQISLLAEEQIDTMRAQGLDLDHGAFGENIVTHGLDLDALPIGRRLCVGDRAVLQVTQHGKKCHTRCAIYYRTGDCIMPTHGLFARVLRGGWVRAGDTIRCHAEPDRFRVAVLTVSDCASSSAQPDEASALAMDLIQNELGARCIALQVREEQVAIQQTLIALCDDLLCDLVVTTGGAGLLARAVTPAATRAVVDREMPGISEAIHLGGRAHTPNCTLGHGICGQRGHTVIANLSSAPLATYGQLGLVLPALRHSLANTTGTPQARGPRSPGQSAATT